MLGYWKFNLLGFSFFLFSCTNIEPVNRPEISRDAIYSALYQCKSGTPKGEKIDTAGHFNLWRSSIEADNVGQYVITAGDAGCILGFEHGPILLDDGYQFARTPNLYQIRDLTVPQRSFQADGMAFGRFAGSDILAEFIIKQRAERCASDESGELSVAKCQSEIANWLDGYTARLDFNTTDGSTGLNLIDETAYWNEERIEWPVTN